MAESRSVTEALDRIASRLEGLSEIPDLAVGPHEKVYLLRAEGSRRLNGEFPPPKHALWYYFFSGTFTDLTSAIPGVGKMESVLSWFPEEVGPIVLEFPDPSLGNPPFDRPPENGYEGVKTNADTLGHTKTHLVFPDGSAVVSLGVNQTKIAPYGNGSAQLWETNTEVIATGSGQFKGAKGLITSDMSAFFNPLVVPLDPTKEPYRSGFPVRFLVYISLSLMP